jgi:tRNA-intron endonuclease, archaea type
MVVNKKKSLKKTSASSSKRERKKTSKVTKKTSRKDKEIKAYFSGDSIVSSSKAARDLFSSNYFGEYVSKKIVYSLSEALYLLEKGKIEVFSNTRKLGFNEVMKKCKKIDKRAETKFLVYKNLRDKGYLLKSALKFGADFRVYDKGTKPKTAHAKWLLFPVEESSEMTWQDFAAKNRVAHSTKKNLLIAIVDSEGSITYYEVAWTRP